MEALVLEVEDDNSLLLKLHVVFFSFFSFPFSFFLCFLFLHPLSSSFLTVYNRVDGTRMTVATENIKLGTSPKRGDIVSFSYDNFSKSSIPVNPQIYRIRTDITWEDIINNDSNNSQLNGIYFIIA